MEGRLVLYSLGISRRKRNGSRADLRIFLPSLFPPFLSVRSLKFRLTIPSTASSYLSLSLSGNLFSTLLILSVKTTSAYIFSYASRGTSTGSSTRIPSPKVNVNLWYLRPLLNKSFMVEMISVVE